MSVLLIEDHGPVRLLTLNRPQARNALSGELITSLYRALVAADADDGVRAVVITGADPAFCAGVDLKEAAALGEAYFSQFETENAIYQVALTRKPVIGAVNGAAFTGGLELALGCDVLIASERAVFADTHVRVGVLPGGGLTARLPQLVGIGWARRMSMTGQVIDAATAERIGLVTEIVAPEKLVGQAISLAAAAAEVVPEMMLPLKEIYTAGSRSQIGRALEIELEIANANQPDYELIESRRIAVTERNRNQLSQAGQ